VLILTAPPSPERIERESKAFAQEGSSPTGNR
jgi:hypothetical protein